MVQVKAVLVAAGLVAGVVLGPAGPASAATTVYTNAAGGYSTNPSSQSGSELVRAITPSIGINAGETRYLSAKLVVYSAAQVTETAAFIDCYAPGSSTVASRTTATTNVLTGTATFTLLVRGLFAAPAGGWQCRLDAGFVNHQADVSGHIYVDGKSYIQDVRGPLSFAHQHTQPSKVLDETSYSSALTSFTAPANVSQFDVIGDVEITTCYTTYLKYACANATRTSGSQALVGVQLSVQQLNLDGSACGGVQTWYPLQGTVVTNTQHHYHLNTYNDPTKPVVVNAGCTSRTFRMWVRTTSNASYNDFMVEDNNETLTAAFA